MTTDLPRVQRRATFRAMRNVIVIAAAFAVSACGSLHTTPPSPDESTAALAQIYFWRAKPGKLDEYTRYVRDVAEPIDREAQRAGAFLSVRTYLANDSTVPWTHMRVFLLRDSAQLHGLSEALTAAGIRLQPDSARRKQQSDYSATLRDRVGATVAVLLKR